MNRMKITVCGFLLIIPQLLFSIENRFEYITAEDGLSQGNIECIFQDSRGFIWIGTFNGLNRYDGYELRIFNHDPNDSLSLSHEHIIRMCEDSGGKLWIATYGAGISVYYPETSDFRRITYAIVENDTVLLRQSASITIGPKGNIWFTDENQGVFVYDTNLNLIDYYRNNPDNPKSIPASYYFGLVFDKEGNGWFGAGNGMLCKKPLDSDDFEVFTFENRIAAADDGIKSMYIDQSGDIWIGTTSQGAYRFNPEHKSFINYRKESIENHISENTVMAFAEDWDGNLLLGIDGGGINIVDLKSDQISTIQYDLGNIETLNTNAVYALYFDRSENLWAGTYSGGVNFQSRYKNKFTKFLPDPLRANSLSYKNVTAVMEDRDGDIWIGTDGGGLNKFDPITKTFKHYRADPSNPDWLQTDVIIHLMEDSDGNIYIASYNHGLTIFDKQTETFRQYLPDDTDSQSAAGIHPWYSFEDSYGIIWIGYLAVGLDQFDKSTETFRHFEYNPDDPNSLYSPNVKIIYEDMAGELWVGTEGGGLHKFDREESNFINYHYDQENPFSIRNDDVRDLYEDSNGRFWIGTGNGLCLMDREKETFTTITKDDGLPGNTINGILEDNSGNLWISTDAGISKFNPDSMTFRNYDKSDGLQGNEFNYTSSMVSSSGEFYFGGKNGFNLFNPDNILDNPFPPPVVITRMMILNKPIFSVPVKEDGEKVYKSVTSINELTLSHRENIVTFEFSALDFGNSAKNQYEYILERFDKEWTKTDASKRFVTYTNLPGGNYIFRVRASNGDGLWTKEELSLELKITPPFWKRKWFIGLVLLTLAIIIYRYIKNREKNLKEQKDILEGKLNERLEEINKQKEEVNQVEADLQKKIKEEEDQKWFNTGMIKISEIISKNKDDIHNLTQSIITGLAEYLEINQGAIYLINDDNEDHIYLELLAAYAPDDKRVVGSKCEAGEGQIGTSFKDKIVIRTDNLPEGYATFSSGLGEEQLRHLVVIPLRLNEIVIGVVELLSFQEIPDLHVNFVEKAGETLTSILTALQAGEKTKKLLEQQKMQAEELSAQEEELRQNLEEMKATQEELERMKESERKSDVKRRKKEEEFLDKLKKQNEELKFEKIMFTALMDNISARITYKDSEARHLRINKTKTKALGLKDQSEIFGKTDPEVFGSSHTVERLKKEIEQINAGVTILNVEELFTQKDGKALWGDTSRIPLKNNKGEVVGGMVITWDITKSKNDEFNLELANELLKNLSKNLPLIMFSTNTEKKIYEIFGEGLKLFKLNDKKSAIKNLFNLFPEIRESLAGKNTKDSYSYSGKVKFDKSEFTYKYLLIKSKSTTNGYSGYIIIDKV